MSIHSKVIGQQGLALGSGLLLAPPVGLAAGSAAAAFGPFVGPAFALATTLLSKGKTQGPLKAFGAMKLSNKVASDFFQSVSPRSTNPFTRFLAKRSASAVANPFGVQKDRSLDGRLNVLRARGAPDSVQRAFAQAFIDDRAVLDADANVRKGRSILTPGTPLPGVSQAIEEFGIQQTTPLQALSFFGIETGETLPSLALRSTAGAGGARPAPVGLANIEGGPPNEFGQPNATIMPVTEHHLLNPQPFVPPTDPNILKTIPGVLGRLDPSSLLTSFAPPSNALASSPQPPLLLASPAPQKPSLDPRILWGGAAIAAFFLFRSFTR